MSAPSSRRDHLEARLATVRERIERACEHAGRDPREVSLIVVTKFFPADDVLHLVDLGVTDVGESREQEASAKHAAVTDRLGADGPRWHFIGQLQTNKAASVARFADVVHTVDRPRLVRALDQASATAQRQLAALVQVDLARTEGASAGRGGARPEAVPALADALMASPGLQLRGVMAVAPLGEDPAPAFDRLRQVAGVVSDTHPQATWISAGMSGDLEAAIAHGATHLRVGRAILGARPPLR